MGRLALKLREARRHSYAPLHTHTHTTQAHTAAPTCRARAPETLLLLVVLVTLVRATLEAAKEGGVRMKERKKDEKGLGGCVKESKKWQEGS